MSSKSARVRRPVDLARLFVTLAIGTGIFAAANLAAQTTTGLESDLVQASRLLPNLIVLIITALGGLLSVLLPAAYVVQGLLERKIRLVIESQAAAIIAILTGISVNNLIESTTEPQLYAIFVGGAATDGVSPINILLAVTLAIAIVLRLTERKFWLIATVAITTILGWSNVLAGAATLVSQVLSAIGGITAGLLVRTLLGTPSTRPSLEQVISEIPELKLSERDITQTENNTFVARLSSGELIELEILDRDSDRAGFLASFWRTIRLRGIESGAGLPMRVKAERLMLANLAARNAGINTAKLFSVKEISADAILVVRERLESDPINDETTNLGETLKQVWQQLDLMHQADIAHRHASLDSFGLVDNKVVVKNLDAAVVASSKLLMALDIAELLLATTQLIGAKQSVKMAVDTFSIQRVFFAARLLQPIAMSASTRANLRNNKSSLSELRTALANLGFDTAETPINVERLKPRTIVLLTLSVAAGYALLNQLAEVNLIEIFNTADTGWMLIALGFSALTYVGATFALTAFSPIRLSWLKAALAHLAASFVVLVTPPAIGAVSVNVRFLQRSGLTPGAAGATVAMNQVVMFGTHILMLIVVSVIAGTTNELRFDPPRWVILTIFLVITVFLTLLLIPVGRNWMLQVTQSLRQQMAPAFVKVISEPKRLLVATSGSILMNLAYILCLAASIRAFGNNTELITVAFIYLAGATLGSLAPTPGGLGAVEAVLVAALIAGGLPAGTAISVTLLYRLVTFWLPVLPGWLSLNYLTRRESL
ncbi:MAG: lysylphosphatidylglycerol synthase transmembrane domain-containing protein [Candidatus Nanopelagicales bacterium]